MTEPYDARPRHEYREREPRTSPYPTGQQQWYTGDHRQYDDGQWRRDGRGHGAGQWHGGQQHGGQWRADHQRQGDTGTGVRTKARRADASRWHWLLLLAVVVPLFTPLYNRLEPQWLGLPFFYWCQLAFAVFSTVVITTVHLATRSRGRG